MRLFSYKLNRKSLFAKVVKYLTLIYFIFDSFNFLKNALHHKQTKKRNESCVQEREITQ
jgi:hypothetical protein